MRDCRARLELGVELRGDEVGVARQLHYLDEFSVRRRAAYIEPCGRQRLLHFAAIRKLVAVAMSLGNNGRVFVFNAETRNRRGSGARVL